jgi:2-oxo-hept-3-ene-1,7-dioate hydratase
MMAVMKLPKVTAPAERRLPSRAFRLPALTILVCLVVAFPSGAECPDDSDVAAYLEDFLARRPSRGFGENPPMEEAECARRKLAAAMIARFGLPVGYKAMFTNPRIQEQFGVTGPAWGYMFADMMLDDGALIPADFGALPLYEADLVAVVGAPGLAEARTPLEALGCISDFAPFIELPDTMVAGSPSGSAIVAVNAAFRGGVLGFGLPVAVREDYLARLDNMVVVMTDEKTGRVLGSVKDSVLMGNPLNAALWLAQALKKEGIELVPGDLLSLGGFFPPAAPEPGSAIRVEYRGLPGDPSIRVSFR